MSPTQGTRGEAHFRRLDGYTYLDDTLQRAWDTKEKKVEPRPPSWCAGAGGKIPTRALCFQCS